jgi:DNA-binding CsgD family transcriptional regulator
MPWRPRQSSRTWRSPACFGITDREAAVIGLLLEGASGRDIAERLYISVKTVENHLTNIYRKVGAKNRVQLFRLIRANALEEPGA